VEWIEMVVVQPNVLHGDKVSREIISVDELLKWKEEQLRPSVEAVLSGVLVFCPGDHCHWCDKTCTARFNSILEEAAVVFKSVEEPDIIDLPDPGLITPEKLGEVKTQIDRLHSILSTYKKSVDSETEKNLSLGIKVPGYKAVKGRITRKWAEMEKAMEVFDKTAYCSVVYKERELLGVTKVLKELDKKTQEEIRQYVTETFGTSIVPESDPRQALNEPVFEKIEGDL
jgi:hypothetical protein